MYHQLQEKQEAGKNAPIPEPAKKKPGITGQTLEQCLEKRKVWDINHSSAKAIHKKIGEMIAVDLQPYSMVEDPGFRRLINHLEPRYQIPSRKFFTETIIPDIYKSVKGKVSEVLSDLKAGMAFTTDLWTSDANNEAFISFTVHGIDSEWQRKHFVLCNRNFTEKHTAENISKILNEMLDEWHIDHCLVHLVLSDNAKNIKNGDC